MKAPISWLKEYTAFTQTPEELSHTFTLAGLEVDAITPYLADFNGVVSALVEDAKPHPNATKLQIATVFDGTSRYQVVCGAKNCRSGIITAFAKIGACLKIGSEKISIKAAELRGVESSGMLCSEDELSLCEQSDGIMELSSDFPLGAPLENLVNDLVFDISLTPNLGHCLSIKGLCRELRAHLKLKVDEPQIHFHESTTLITKDLIQVEIENSEDCHQYSCRVISGLQSTITPWFIKQALQKSGIRSKHLVVDVLNYVMLECGQPMHAFDYDKLATKKIIIKKAPHHIDFTILGGETRKIPTGTLMIYEGEKPIAIAGIMGGEETSIQESNTTILLEAAHFSSQLIRKGMKNLGLRSESSNRFEKGIDQLSIELALDRAVTLIEQYGKCEIASGISTTLARPYSDKKIECQFRNISRILGIELSKSEIEEYLHRLDIKIRFHGDESYHVIIPSYRNDIESEIDVIEEIARIYGYNNIPMRSPLYSTSQIPHHPMFAFEKAVRTTLLSQGLQELLTCNLISPLEAKIGPYLKSHDEETIFVMHAKSEDQSVLRSSFIPGFIQCALHNQNYGCYHLAGFEIGKVHFKDGSNYVEKWALGILITGNRSASHFSEKPELFDFLDIKGILKNLFEKFHIETTVFSKTAFSVFHPGQQAEIVAQDSLLGIIGQIHPTIQKSKDFRAPLYYAQIDLEALFRHTNHHYTMKPLPLFPSSDRDLTVHVHRSLPIQKVFDAIHEEKLPLLESIELKDIYESESLGLDRKSVTLRFVYRDLDKTTESQDVEKIQSMILPILQQKLQGSLFT